MIRDPRVKAQAKRKPPITKRDIDICVDSYLGQDYTIGKLSKGMFKDLEELFKIPLIKGAFQSKLLDLILKSGYGAIGKTNYWKIITFAKGCGKSKCEVCGGKKKLKIDCNSMENLDNPTLLLKDMNCLCESCIKIKYKKPNPFIRLYLTIGGLSAIICGLVYFIARGAL